MVVDVHPVLGFHVAAYKLVVKRVKLHIYVLFKALFFHLLLSSRGLQARFGACEHRLVVESAVDRDTTVDVTRRSRMIDRKM